MALSHADLIRQMMQQAQRAAASSGSSAIEIGDSVRFKSGMPTPNLLPGTELTVVDIVGRGLVIVRARVPGHGTVDEFQIPEHFIELVKGPAQKAAPKSKKKLDPAILDAVVIEEATKEEVKAVLHQHEHQDKLFKEWGLGETIKYGKGMTFLFYGPPGTGKTYMATKMAEAMGMELLTIGAAEIQTSEPGGANRNIQNAFASAREQEKVLFLDECDSLITLRNDVGMVLASEINTLLTEIEKFEGIAILATNRIENLDEALERRISLIVEFPEPKYEERLKIWERMLPKKMPLEKEVDLKKLAEYKLTGGQIKNVVLQAARLALSEKEVGVKHFEAAIARIQQSKSLMGTASSYRRVRIREDFGVGHGVQKDTVISSDVSKSRSTTGRDRVPDTEEGEGDLPS